MKQGWHFMTADCCLNYGDGRKAVVGETLTVDCKPVLCESGLHASERIIDALDYAPGPVCTLVEVGGEIVAGDYKFAGQSRKVIWMKDITELLHNFACDVAEQALNDRRKAGDRVDPHSTAAIDAKRKWLKGEITDVDLAAAKDAARDAARAAAWGVALDAAKAAARKAAWGVALDAARAAAWDAAWDAARAAARDAAWDAARADQNTELDRRVRLLMEKET